MTAATAPSLRDDLLTLSREIHADPELAYEERRASDRICALLVRNGFAVERPLGGLATAFRAHAGQAVPADYVSFPVSAERIGGHNIEMRESSVSDLAHRNAMTTVDVLASAAVRIATDASLRSELKRTR